MHGCFSFCLFTCSFVDFLKNRTLILIKDKLLPVSKHGFFWSEENVHLNHFPTQDGVSVLVSPVIFEFLNFRLECIHLKPDECIMSYDVNALFTSIPIKPAVNIIKKHLEDDKELHLTTPMTVKHIFCLLEFFLENTYFSFQSRFYDQTQGAAMGSPISPIVANLFMEDLEVQAINTSPTPLALWKRICG